MTKDYPEAYKEDIFHLWYDNGKSFNGIMVKLPSYEDKTPSIETLKRWKHEMGWQTRADALDAEYSRTLDQHSIEKRRKMFLRHEEVGTALVNKGMQFLEKGEIEDAQDALRAIDLGIRTQIASVGIAENFVKFANMTNDQLSKALEKYLPKKEEVEYIEGEEIDANKPKPK